MKNLILSTGLILMSCIGYSQPTQVIGQDTQMTEIPMKPVFFGELNGDTCYCWNYKQAKEIALNIEDAKYCDTLIAQMEIEIAMRDSAIQAAQKQIADQKKLVSGLNNSNAVVSEMYHGAELIIAKLNGEIKVKDKKIKFLKFQRVAYPVITAIALISLFILIK
jgi:hypothetical protein